PEAVWVAPRGVGAGGAPPRPARHDLLALLTHLVACRAVNQLKHELGVQKRGAGRVRDESALESLAGSDGPTRALDRAAGPDRSPPEQALLHDCYHHYVHGLPANLR